MPAPGSPGDLHAAVQQIQAQQRWLLTSHLRPDGDAVGSLLGLGMTLAQLGKQVEMVLADPVPMIYQTLPGVKHIQHAKRASAGFDAVLLLECDAVSRCGLTGLDGKFLINLDHHASATRYANINWIEPDACAVAAMVHLLAHSLGAHITPDIATCLYTAVLTDTGMFAYRGTDADTLRLAASLVDAGANPPAIARDVYFSNPTSKIKLLGAALSRLHREGRVAWLWVTQEDLQRCDAVEEDCEGVVNYAIGISGVDVAAFLRELPDGRVRVSLRSKDAAVNTAAIAFALGGGGHESASGCTLPGPLPAALETMLATLRNSLPAHP